VLFFILAFYFLVIEVVQAREEGLKEHFVDFWNYLDLIPIISLIICYVAQLIFGNDD
jgi:hypothetical protein